MLKRINEMIEKYNLFKDIVDKTEVSADKNFYDMICFFNETILIDLEELKKLIEG
jgi:hypothetical protein